MLKYKSRTILTLFALAFAGLALAKAPVEGRIEAFIVSTNADGQEIVEPAVAAVPGELMEYRLTFTNSGESAVSGLNVVDPIPANTTFVSASASSDAAASFEVSIDGGKSFESEPVLRIETQIDGTQKEVVIPPAQYTHLRWAVEEALDGEGGAQNYAYRVIVN